MALLLKSTTLIQFYLSSSGQNLKSAASVLMRSVLAILAMLAATNWFYPDLVGMEDLSGDWHREIKDCVQKYADKKTKLWLFEVKILINRSNLRKVFFQAVSNSSWANFRYLVASEIERADTLKELRMLASLHGISFTVLMLRTPP